MRDMKNCIKKFLFWSYETHDFDLVDIKEEVKIIGKKYGQYETGIYVRRFITTKFFKCKNCPKEKQSMETKEETCRQYH